MSRRFLFAAALTLASSAALGQPSVPSGLANDLKLGADESPYLLVPASGVQIYECAAKEGGYEFEWKFKAPEAQLYDAKRQAIGKHYGGPTWEAEDGSKIKGSVKAKQDAPAGNIPWLLLATSSEGTGRFADVTHIHRVNTVGGIAPKAGCDSAQVGKLARVPYTADYVLYRKRK